MALAPAGAVFLASAVATGWAAVALVLTPLLLLVALLAAARAPALATDGASRVYRGAVRFSCVWSAGWLSDDCG